MNAEAIESLLVSRGCRVEILASQERRLLETTWRSVFSMPVLDQKGRVANRWVHRNALDLYRAERPSEFFVVPDDGKDPAFRCRNGELPEFGFDGVRVWSGDLKWTMLFSACDLDGGPYFVRREWNEPPA
jgi:hypothetical protein